MPTPDFASFFAAATGHAPYDYQRRLTCGEGDARFVHASLAAGIAVRSRPSNISASLDYCPIEPSQ